MLKIVKMIYVVRTARCGCDRNDKDGSGGDSSGDDFDGTGYNYQLFIIETFQQTADDGDNGGEGSEYLCGTGSCGRDGIGDGNSGADDLYGN